ncbi:zinc finger protein 43-like isoform X2 [Condylostylus longicornis]|uniref:zinc finger protein 43-like isoform X2 n=1 Tax=Condylostylus longicornis TaxID=2530218 RepID=UPI00244DF6A6|nr:zinc finger protein 43-like isoform X2 [Condylostylus longicornis]
MNILNINEICRVCLNINVHNTYKMSSILDEIISLKLKLCGGIIIDEEFNTGYPKLICEPCCKNLEIAYDFRTTCENSERALRKLILEVEATKKHKEDSNLLEDFENSSNECFPEVEHIGSHIKEELMTIEDINDSRSLERNTFSGNKCGEKNLDSFLQSKEQQLKVGNEISNKIRKYVKKSVFKPETPGDTKAKRKYTKKTLIQKAKLKKEDSKYVCEFCDLEYKGKSSFTYHMRRHTNELNYVCEICGTAFETNFKLKRHFLKHMGTLPYSCRTCDMKFSSSSNRDRHERRLHTTIRPFQCTYCEKAFSYSDQLKNHIRVHTDVCEKCGSAFKRKSHLSAHSNALTPCVIKMTLKNKIVNEKTKLSKICKNNTIKSKSSKSSNKNPTNSNVRTTVKENISTAQKCHPQINAFIAEDNYSSDIKGKQNEPDQDATENFENEDQLNFYNINIIEQSPFVKKNGTDKQ